MLINAANLLVCFAMVFDGPTRLGLRPQNENLHLEECSEWVQFTCLVHTNTQHQAGGILGIIFHTSPCKKALMSGGGVEGLGKGHKGGASSIGGGGCTTPQGGMGEVRLWFG